MSSGRMVVDFRLAGPEDLPAILLMMKELQADDPWSVPFDDGEAAKAADQILRDSSLGRVWIIDSGTQPIGYIVMAFDYSLEYRGRGAWIDEFFVRKTFRGMGIGSQALKFFLDQARELGATVVHLEVNHDNPAVELYHRQGFEDHRRYLMTKWIVDRF